jgi:trimeric autotransporter adhesin
LPNSRAGCTGSIQWYSSTDGSAYTIVNGATSTPLSTGNLTQKTWYRATVTSGVCSSANSSVATVDVSPASVGGTATPAASPVCSGSAPTINLLGSTGNVTKWQYSSDNFASDMHDLANTTTTLNNAPTITATTYYRAVVQSGVCSVANSSTATVTVNPLPTAPDAGYTRGQGASLKIKISDLTTDTLQSLGTATHGTVSKDTTYIFYEPYVGDTNNDSFTYTTANSYCSKQATITVTVVVATGQAQTITVVDGKATVKFAGIPSFSYTVQRATDVNFTQNLTPVLTTNAPADGSFTFVDNSPPGSQACYRLKYNP